MPRNAATSNVTEGGRTIRSGDCEALFVPGCGMLCASFKFRGIELLRRIEDLDVAAAKGSTAGIPLLHPWANRLGGLAYRAAGREVVLDPKSPLVHLDGNGLPIHGVPWSKLDWSASEIEADRIVAGFDWRSPDMLAVFPFPHRLEMTATVDAGGLAIRVRLSADTRTPVSFGFHPYFGLPGVARDEWRLVMPPMRKLVLDSKGIPTGERTEFPAFDGKLAGVIFDDGFETGSGGARFVLEGGGLRLSIDFEDGYPFAQVYNPPGKDFIAIEPMTAPTNALVSGDGLRILEAGEVFSASFGIRVAAIEN